MRFLAWVFALTAGIPVGARATSADRCVTLLATSDVHGTFEAHQHKAESTTLRYGGLIALATYVERLREQRGARLVLVDGGDIFQGSLASNLSQGRAAIAAFNDMGYVAAAVGNHEFDYGPVTPKDKDRLGVLRARMAEAAFPFLAVNVFERSTHRRLRSPNLHPSTLVDAGGVKVGIVGAATVDTPRVTKPHNVAELEFPDPAPLIVAESMQLRARGAELVVLVAHIGSICKGAVEPHDAHDLTSCNREDELFTLLARLPPGIVDVAFGGHTHAFVAHWVAGVPTVVPGARATHLGQVEACVAPGGGLDRARSRIEPFIEVCVDAWQDGRCDRRKKPTPLTTPMFAGAAVTPSARVGAVLRPYLRVVEDLAIRPVGATLAAPLLRDAGTPSLGELVAESMRVHVGADFGLQNLGGVRADLAPGKVQYQHVYEVLPFDNQVCRLEMTGAQVRQLVHHLIGRRSGDVPYLAGLRARRERTDVVIERADGTPLVNEQRYTLATNDFLVLGGEDLHGLLATLAADGVRITDTDMRDALIELLRTRYPSAPVEPLAVPTPDAAY